MTEADSDPGEGVGRRRSTLLPDLFTGPALLALLLTALGPGAVFLLAIACLLAAFFFSLFENSLTSYSSRQLMALARKREQEERIDGALAREDEAILVSKLGRALCHVLGIAGLVAWVDSLGPSTPGAVAWGIGITLFFLLFNVSVPYVLGRRFGHAVLARGLLPYVRFVRLLYAPVNLLQAVASRLFGAGDPPDPSEEITDEILSAVEEGERQGVIEDSERQMIKGVMDLREVTADHVMTPRTEMISISVDSSVAGAIEASRSRGLSRLPVFRDTPDNVVGVLYLKDLLSYLASNEEPPPITRLMRRPFFVPESKSVNELLAEMKASQIHMAIVLDEYGGTAGVVTIEDIIEEIVGEIADEYESAEPSDVQKITDNAATVEGRTHIDELNEALGLEIPESDEYETVGGFLFSRMGRVPRAGEHIDLNGIRFTVLDADERRINRVKVAVQRR